MNISTENLYESVRKYLELIDITYKNKQHLKITFSKGYYWSELKPLQNLEKSFLKLVNKNESYILDLLKKESKDENKALIMHLLGWSTNYSNTPKILSSYFKSKDISIANAAARALFPMVTSNKTSLPIKEVHKLLKRGDRHLKNKALGLLAFSNEEDIKKAKKLISREYLQKLSRSKESMVNGHAKRLIDRFNSV